VIIISIDTLRADHLPAYGYKQVETPAIDGFRRDAVLFENAYAEVPLTLPSHMVMLTGSLPPDNGVRDNIGYPFDRASGAASCPFWHLSRRGDKDERGAGWATY
jgi:arylsulfatase A-like enzyme